MFSWFALDFGRNYDGHITIVPDLSAKIITQSLSNPSAASMQNSIQVFDSTIVSQTVITIVSTAWRASHF